VPYSSESGDITVALTGETLASRRFSRFSEPQFLALRDILRSADVAFTNIEMLFHDYEGSPTSATAGTFMRADPAVADDLAWFGFNLVSCAMNHGYDYTETGVLVNKAHITRAGMANAGSGANLTLARSPAYFDSPGGRVALIAATDHVNVPDGRAVDPRPEVRGRAGVNMIRTEPLYYVESDAFEELRALDRRLGWETRRQGVFEKSRYPSHWFRGSEDEFFFGPGLPGWFGSFIRVRRGENSRGDTVIVNEHDRAENLKWIRDARRMADWVIFSFHTLNHGVSHDDPSEHFVQIAHEAIEQGADVVVGHGLHRDRGIEIYRGRPIFYSLGNIFTQNDTPTYQPSETYERYGLNESHTPADFYFTRSRNETVGQDVSSDCWQTVIASVHWQARKLHSIRLVPVDLRPREPIAQRGRPLLADGDVADEVLGRIERCSAQFGTVIQREEDFGQVLI
jgi:poly-gamma-glutamate capsule biosynthesis protein CapA/YwtB (metallophosphatase superfamily)